MDSTLGLASAAALFGAMLVLAAIPSVSVLAVTARAAASGFVHGALTTLGIVVGDAVFIAIAVIGLSVLADAMGGLFVLVKYLGGAYLVVLGVLLLRSGSRVAPAQPVAGHSLRSSFLAGLLITLGDQKAILFYLGFFPAFVDVPALTALDIAAILVIATVAVGGVKLVYAYLAHRVGTMLGAGRLSAINRIAGLTVIAVGAAVILRS